MAPRFPIDEAADPAAGQFIEQALNAMHGGQPPFKWKEDDGRSLIACYAPLWCVPDPGTDSCRRHGRLTNEATPPRLPDNSLRWLRLCIDLML